MTAASEKGQLRFSTHLSGRAFTRMHASIVEEDDAFSVSVRMFNHSRPSENATGEHVAETFDIASMMIDDLACEFEIPPDCVRLRIVMARFRDGTIH